MNLPNLDKIEALHHKYTPADSVFDLVFTHCKIVSDIAQQCIANKHLAVDAELVKVGCLLHDIGVYPLFDKDGKERRDLHYIIHGIRGEEILRAEGLPEIIYRFASHHTGAGITKQGIKDLNLPLPPRDYLAETPEEELIMYADKFHSKWPGKFYSEDEPPCFNTYEWSKRHVAKFGEDKVEKLGAMAEKFGVPDLEPLVAQYGYTTRY